MVAPQAEAVLARPGLPDVLHKVTARRHLQALGVQSEGLVYLGRTVRGWLILHPALWRGLVGGRRGSQSDFLERKNMGLIKDLPPEDRRVSTEGLTLWGEEGEEGEKGEKKADH